MEGFDRKQFERDGYSIIPNFINDEEADALRSECWNIIEEMNPADHCPSIFNTCDPKKHISNDYFLTSGDKIRFFFEDGALDKNGKLQVDKQRSMNKMGHALHVLNPAFRKTTFSNNVKKVIREIGLIDPVVCQSMYIFKQPKLGGEVTPHQDSTFLKTDPMKLIGLWIALEDATLENGCLWFIPGSHKAGINGNRRMIRNPDAQPGDPLITFTGETSVYDEKRFVPAEVKKGTCVVIHGEVVHKSHHNTSEKSRQIYTFHIYDSKDTVYSNKNWLQETEEVPFPHLYTFN